MVGRIAFSTKTDDGFAKEKHQENNGGDGALRLL